MPKVTLTFILPEETYEHNCAAHGADWKDIVYEVAMLLRNNLKYGHSYKTADEALEAVKLKLWEECKDHNLNPWSD